MSRAVPDQQQKNSRAISLRSIAWAAFAFREPYPTDSAVLSRTPGWDSLRLMNFLLELERTRNIAFEAQEITGLVTWGDLFSLAERKLGPEQS